MESNACRWSGRTAFVTGGNSGIGAAIVRQLVDTGINVVSFDKNTDKLEALADEYTRLDKGKLYPIKGDLRKEDDILSAFDWVEKNLGVVHILVNNAGCVTSDTILDGETQNWRDMIDVNFLAVAICTREAVKSMRAHGFDEGHILNINSICGQNVLTYVCAVYTATKYAVGALTVALRKQLSTNKSRIRVTSIIPGCVQTNMLNDAPLLPAESRRTALSPSDVAGAILYALSLPREVHIGELLILPEVEFDGRSVDEAAKFKCFMNNENTCR